MKGLNTFALKMIAISSMLIDHMGAVLFPQHEWMRLVGRLAFPIFAYLLVEGIFYTKDMKKYMLRLGAFALISEVPFDLAFFGTPLEFSHQNVFFTLFLGVFMFWLMLRTPVRWKHYLILCAVVIVADLLYTDYGSWGILMMVAFYELRDRKWMKLAMVAFINVCLMGYSQVYAAFAMIPVAFHNRQLGPKMKMFFYVFYPAHLIILYLIGKAVL